MIRSLHIEGLRALANVTIDFHESCTVVVGPTGSGKSSVLDAIALLFAAARDEYAGYRVFGLSDDYAGLTSNDWCDILVQGIVPDDDAEYDQPNATAIGVYLGRRGLTRLMCSACHQCCSSSTAWKRLSSWSDAGETRREIRSTIAYAAEDERKPEAMLLRLDPRAMAEPDPIELGSARMFGSGQGLAGFLGDRFFAQDRAFDDVVDDVRAILQWIHNLRVRRVDLDARGGPVPGFQLEALVGHDRSRIGQERWMPAKQLGSGALQVIGLLAAAHAFEGAMLLVDGFGDGLPPATIDGLATKMQEAARRHDYQVVLAANNPYVLDCFEMDQVICLAVRDNGEAAALKLSSHPDADRLRGALHVGEFWSAIGDDWVTKAG